MTRYGQRLVAAVRVLADRVRAEVKARAGARSSRWTPELGDALLYAGGAMFAVITGFVSWLPLYRTWGTFAVGPYLGGALLSLVLWQLHLRRRSAATAGAAPAPTAGAAPAPTAPVPDATRHAAPSEPGARPERRRWHHHARVWVLAAVLIGAALVPLSVEILQRVHGHTSAHAQPEVVVIQQAGDRLAQGKEPYHAFVSHGHLESAVRGEPAYESFFPYLPLMALFGLPSSTHLPVQLTDARIFFSAVTLVVAGVALLLSRAPRDRKLRAFQVIAVLPTAALPLATGGDDMPVVALLLLAMVLAQRRRPGWSGIVLGIVSAMKFTAWPMAALALFAARDRQGRRAPGRMLAGMAVVAGPVVAPFAAANLAAFFSNVILFPLGLSGVASPAASNLPGHLLVLAFPWLHRALPLVVGLVGGAILVRRIWRHPPATAATVAYLSGWVMLVALTFAPATRVGYLLYPANFFVWGWMLNGERQWAATPEPASPTEALVAV